MTQDLLLPAALLAGFLGSGHCFGMCGPVVVLLENQQAGAVSVLIRRVSYNMGRMAFYVFLGAVAGGIGLVMTKIAGIDAALRVLRLVAALLVIAIGLNLLLNMRLLAFVEKAGARIWRRMAPLARHVLPANNLPRAMAAGFIWGALPCGLVYSAVAMAATTGSTARGAAVMLSFWLGTLPALMFAGAAAARLSTLTGNRLLRATSGLLLIGIGLFALYVPLVNAVSGGHEHRAAAVTGVTVERI